MWVVNVEGTYFQVMFGREQEGDEEGDASEDECDSCRPSNEAFQPIYTIGFGRHDRKSIEKKITKGLLSFEQLSIMRNAELWNACVLLWSTRWVQQCRSPKTSRFPYSDKWARKLLLRVLSAYGQRIGRG